MICTSVVPCLSSGLAKSSKIMSVIVVGFFRKRGDTGYTKAVKKMFSVNFTEVQQLNNNFSKKRGYFD